MATISLSKKRYHIEVTGWVQGVGFRPYVHRLATGMGLFGWVRNSSNGVEIEVEGEAAVLASFIHTLPQQKPPHAIIASLQTRLIPCHYIAGFVIRPSLANPGNHRHLPLDLATCHACKQELFDPGNRRYHYPFINCTDCGPRYSILTGMPYDRANTTMAAFALCDPCAAEYHDPGNRRFHAEPNACPRCGPVLQYGNRDGTVVATADAALQLAITALRDGKIIAVKGLGGFHLLVDARIEEAVLRLRTRKHRRRKPFAVMFPDLAQVATACELSAEEASLLASPQAPIVLLQRLKENQTVCKAVAPDQPTLGVMLPYTPLHHLLLDALGFPVVATSGNLSDEPLCKDETEMVAMLDQIADAYLAHNRPIANRIDDSVLFVSHGKPVMLRAARGYAPLHIELDEAVLRPLMATGGQLKNTVALAAGHSLLISPHIGDLSALATVRTQRETIETLCSLYAIQPERVACDLHPDYQSTRTAEKLGLPLTGIQHHEAHARSCMAEHRLRGKALGIVWDGTGYGTDGTIWGGEFLQINIRGFQRVAHFLPFPLPGGERAIREPRRAALGVRYAIDGDDCFADLHVSTNDFSTAELAILQQMLTNRTNCPMTSSVGRLFDAVASLTGLCHVSDFEGEAAMALQHAAAAAMADNTVYPFVISPLDESGLNVDWRPMLRQIIDEVAHNHAVGRIAANFHMTLAQMAVTVAQQIGEKVILLSGGCFQNRLLQEQTCQALKTAGFEVYHHHLLPANDGGLAAGQIMTAIPIFQET
ncbi:MAG: carbamoyltransferase HypF [Nitrosomonas sp.]|nr:carbamoyltransferase HypF [Nitrosomonas sp.]